MTDGEPMTAWAIGRAEFWTGLKQFTHCARCGEPLPAQPYDRPRFCSNDPVRHFICGDCHAALPDDGCQHD